MRNKNIDLYYWAVCLYHRLRCIGNFMLKHSSIALWQLIQLKQLQFLHQISLNDEGKQEFTLI